MREIHPMTALQGNTADCPGKFEMLARYQGARKVVRGSLFSSPDPVDLHDREIGEATVQRAVLGQLKVGLVRSTGHDVTVRESTAVSLVLPMQGTMTTEIGGKTAKAGRGMGLLLPRGQRKTRIAPYDADRFLGLVVMLEGRELSGIRHVELAKGLVLDPSRSRDIADALQMTRLLGEQLESGSRVLDRPGAANSWFDLITSSIDQGIEALAGDTPQSDAVGHDAYRYVAQAEDYMRWNLVDITTTVDVARELGVSRRTLETAFQRVRGDSPARVLYTLRLHTARKMLLDACGPASVTEVCLDCGIGHHGRFSAAYRQAFGETPSETLRRR
jgi:AraC-like DNA-binding protein